MEITSVNNDLVKECAKFQQKKYRDLSGKFLLEGYKAIKEAFDFGVEIETIFVQKDAVKKYLFAKDFMVETNEAVLKKLSSTDSAPDAVAVGIKKEYCLQNIKDAKKIILLENPKDAGNIGTIIRTAVAFGADGIILYGNCVDLYNPKIVRSAVGNLWKIPVIGVSDFAELKNYAKNFNRIATLPRSKNNLKNYKPKYPLMLMFGSEADGLSDELINFSTDNVKIEMSENVESLNLATSVAVMGYELFI